MQCLLSPRAFAVAATLLTLGCSSAPEAPRPLENAAAMAVRTLPGGPSLRGLCAVSQEVAWVTGSGPTVAVTVDGGATWKNVTPASIQGEEPALDVRDVQAKSERTAWILCAGPGEASRILRTDDGGKSWALEHQETDPRSFLDGFDMGRNDVAVAYGDPLEDGRFRVLLRDPITGRWRTAPAPPAANAGGEAAFAASGTGIRMEGSRVLFVTGANDGQARALRSSDFGATWDASPVPIPAPKPASGAFSVALGPGGGAVAVGGDFTARERGGVDNAAYSRDGGRTWSSPEVGPRGQRAGSCALGDSDYLCTGQTGTDVSRDGGRTWSAFSDEGFHCVDRAPDGTLWFAGHEGRVARLR